MIEVESIIREDYQTDAVPLDLAVLCVDCRQITPASDGRCRLCGAEGLPLAPILDRRNTA